MFSMKWFTCKWSLKNALCVLAVDQRKQFQMGLYELFSILHYHVDTVKRNSENTTSANPKNSKELLSLQNFSRDYVCIWRRRTVHTNHSPIWYYLGENTINVYSLRIKNKLSQSHKIQIGNRNNKKSANIEIIMAPGKCVNRFADWVLSNYVEKACKQQSFFVLLRRKFNSWWLLLFWFCCIKRKNKAKQNSTK